MRVYNEELVLSPASTVKTFKILPKGFHPSTGELGPTLKLKRSFIIEKYIDEIESIYA